MTYNQADKHIKGILSKYWYIQLHYAYLKNKIPNKPILEYRRAKTLRNYLAPSDITKH